jgi:acyl dehydratase
MEPKYYEEIQVGEEYSSRGRTVTQTDKINFLNMTRNNEELFANREYYETQGLFRGEIVPGPLTYLIAIGLIQSLGLFDGIMLAFLGMDEFRLPKPVFCGDTLYLDLKVLDKRQKHADRGIITFEKKVRNQDGETVLICKFVIMIRCKSS